MSGITVVRKPRMPKFNGRAVAAVIKAIVPGAILERTNRGVDANGNQFAPYSNRYIDFLLRGGESPKVDLRLSGGLLNSVKARGADVNDNRVTIIVAPDAGTSPVWKPKAGGLARFEKRLAKGKQTAGSFTMQRTGKQSPPHNVVAHWLHYGTAHTPARRFLALTKEQTEMLFREIQKVAFKLTS